MDEFSELVVPTEVIILNRRKVRHYLDGETHVDLVGTLDPITLCGRRNSVSMYRKEVRDEEPVTCGSCIEGLLAGFRNWSLKKRDIDVSTYWMVGGNVLAGVLRTAENRRAMGLWT